MAALRSGLAMFGRRRSCGSCTGSSAATSMGGKGMEIHQGFHHAPPPFRPAAARDLEGWRHFSTGGGESKDKANSFLRLWRWAKYRVENADQVTKSRIFGVYALMVIGTPTVYMVNNAWRFWRPTP